MGSCLSTISRFSRYNAASKSFAEFCVGKKGIPLILRFCLNVLHTDPRQSQKRGAEEAGFNELWKGENSSIYSAYNRCFIDTKNSVIYIRARVD